MRELCSGAKHLYGDYDLLIMQCLKGNVAIKEAVAKADNKNRGGLKLLIKALNNIQLSDFQQRVLRQCKEDQEYYEQKQEDYDHIVVTPLGKFRVQIMVEYNRFSKNFKTLQEAQKYRDKCFRLNQDLLKERRSIAPLLSSAT